MALQLTLEPTLVGVQVAILCAGVALARSLFVNPYLNLSRLQAQATSGLRQSARDTLAEAQACEHELARRLKDARKRAVQQAVAVRSRAVASHEAQVEAASLAAKAWVSEQTAILTNHFEASRKEILGQVENLSAQIVQALSGDPS